MKHFIFRLIFVCFLSFPSVIFANTPTFNIEGIQFYTYPTNYITIKSTEMYTCLLLPKDIEVDMRNDSPIIKYWTVLMASEAGYDQRTFDNDYAKNVKMKLIHEEIDKNNKNMRILRMIYLDNNLDVIRNAEASNAPWNPIVPNSNGETIYNEVCDYIRSYFK